MRKMQEEEKTSTAATLLFDAIKDRFSFHLIFFAIFVVVLGILLRIIYGSDLVEHMNVCNVHAMWKLAENGCDYENTIYENSIEFI